MKSLLNRGTFCSDILASCSVLSRSLFGTSSQFVWQLLTDCLVTYRRVRHIIRILDTAGIRDHRSTTSNLYLGATTPAGFSCFVVDQCGVVGRAVDARHRSVLADYFASTVTSDGITCTNCDLSSIFSSSHSGRSHRGSGRPSSVVANHVVVDLCRRSGIRAADDNRLYDRMVAHCPHIRIGFGLSHELSGLELTDTRTRSKIRVGISGRTRWSRF